MRKLIYSGIIFFLSLVILLASIIFGEKINAMFWWQAIGMAIISLGTGGNFFARLKAYKKDKR